MRHSIPMSTRAVPRRRFGNRDRRALEQSGWRTMLEYTENQWRDAEGRLLGVEPRWVAAAELAEDSRIAAIASAATKEAAWAAVRDAAVDRS